MDIGRMATLAHAKEVLGRTGWLSQQPEAFQAEIWRKALLQRFMPDDVVFRVGDPIGGIYGIISGAVTVTTSPVTAAPRLFHVGVPGDWIGEGPFLVKEPRRVGMQAAIETWMVYLAVTAMEEIASHDPLAVRRFTKLLMMNLDTLVKAFYDLHSPDELFRVAATLERITSHRENIVPLSQSDIGVISNTSRKQVNAALKHFEAAGWLRRGYRSMVITDRAGLTQFIKEKRLD
ncbi:Crp/Fnr family transcriptional regulator [Bradyrhizobium lablabi]|uniref:Crp/Fnr family transcriptional regulator n=1 Tax=Bradyrhizobium lablabi TaxID=722472 RepID=UPI001BA826E8|nr:Crp/Fnr family transcriptional regulator [Bradyrhizobium lablabi]MBR0693720.1 Crp/Fnr family transcriptional regulator [Bradyrhizobium lablabi]